MDRTEFLAAYGPTRAPSPVDRVVVVVIDDMSMDLLQHPQRYTPNLDRLASSAVSFTNARCTVPVCGGARGGLWFSRYPHETGVYGNNDSPWADVSLTPWTDHARSAGWRVARIGKMHHYVDPRPDGGADRHFPSRCATIVTPARPAPDDRPLNGVEGYSVNYDFGPVDVHPALCGDSEAIDEAIDEVVMAGEPTLVVVGLTDAHVPIYPPAAFFAMVPDADTVLVPAVKPGDLDDVPDGHAGLLDLGWYADIKAAGQLEELQRAWLAMIAYLDWNIGRLLDAVDLSRTVVVVTSDHGYTTGQLGSVGKVARFDRISKVPLLIAAPTWPHGLRVSQPVSQIDLGPTMLSLMGVSLPLTWPCTGVDLAPLAFDPAAAREPVLVTSLFNETYGRRYSVIGPQYAFHDTRKAGPTSGSEVYDWWADPENSDNLYDWTPGTTGRIVRDRLHVYAPDDEDVAAPLGGGPTCAP